MNYDAVISNFGRIKKKRRVGDQEKKKYRPISYHKMANAVLMHTHIHIYMEVSGFAIVRVIYSLS